MLALPTVAVNCFVPLEETVAVVGEIVTLTGAVPAGLIVTVALACLLLSATLVTVTEIWVVEVTVGAVNKPVVEIVPAPAVQITAWFVVLLTVSVNCFVLFAETVAVVGETETLTPCAGGVVLAAPEENPHDAFMTVIRSRSAPRNRLFNRDTVGGVRRTVLQLVPGESSVMYAASRPNWTFGWVLADTV